MHVVLMIVGVVAALMIVNSPNPIIGLIVLMLAVGVEIPVAVWTHLGSHKPSELARESPPDHPPPQSPTAPA